MKKSDIMYYVGEGSKGNNLPIFSEEVCEFLGELSAALIKNPIAKGFSDIITFAFWIRPANLQRYRHKYLEDKIRLGKGMVFHIAPSNVPINFAFSLVFGLLSGNANVVRVSGKRFDQTQIICDSIKEVLKSQKYPNVEKNITIISYPHSREISDYYSKCCATRVIWGGDKTISEIRKSPLSPRATEITFADRYSFSIIDSVKIKHLNKESLQKLAKSFYNDTFLIDQNACSSPHLIVWKNESLPESDVKEVQEKFWRAVQVEAEKWEIKDIHATEKYLLATEHALNYPQIKGIHRHSNLLYIMDMDAIIPEMVEIRGKFGLFSQTVIKDYKELIPLSQKNTQTITYYGIDAKELADFFRDHGVDGVDRIVPFGKSLELDLIWDGYDIIRSLSRIIDYHE